jgi:large subunit ribosomal protein L17e
LRVHFKNTYETGKAIKGMLVKKAENYLNDVLNHTRCVPFTKYDGSTGRTGQAKEWGLTHGRWPEKSVRHVLSILKNAISNAESKRLNVDNLIVRDVRVNQAMRGRRRTYRAHGRINAYLSSNCHIEIFCEELKERVKKGAVEKKDEIVKVRNVKRHIRGALSKAYRERKYVEVGGKK